MASLGSLPAGDVAPYVTGGSLSGEIAARHADRHHGDPRLPTDAAFVETVGLLEAAAIALGTSEITPECMGLARAADAALRVCSHDPSAAARLARLFHQTLLAACPNTHMLELICRETPDATPSQRLIDVAADDLGRVADDHEAILDMIAAGASSRDLERSLRQHASSSALCSMGLYRS